MWDRDPKFGKALKSAFKAGVRIWCITVNVTLEEITFLREIPVNLNID
jgi:DNA-binding sugar fermentation-stimulating protein